jgi:hypothetical protein
MSAAAKRRSRARQAGSSRGGRHSTFSITDSRSTRLYSWNTMPMRRRASRSARPWQLRQVAAAEQDLAGRSGPRAG